MCVIDWHHSLMKPIDADPERCIDISNEDNHSAQLATAAVAHCTRLAPIFPSQPTRSCPVVAVAGSVAAPLKFRLNGPTWSAFKCHLALSCLLAQIYIELRRDKHGPLY